MQVFRISCIFTVEFPCGHVDLGLLHSKFLKVISKSKGLLSNRIPSTLIELANREICVVLNKELPALKMGRSYKFIVHRNELTWVDWQ